MTVLKRILGWTIALVLLIPILSAGVVAWLFAIAFMSVIALMVWLLTSD